MQAGKLYAGTVEVVEDDLAICSSRGYMRAELAVGPLDIVDAQALALAGVRVCIVEDSSTQISLVDDAGILDADRLEQLLAGEDGMGALAVDVEGRDVEARLVACMLRIACADTGNFRHQRVRQPGAVGLHAWGPRRVGRRQRLGDEALKVRARPLGQRQRRRRRYLGRRHG